MKRTEILNFIIRLCHQWRRIIRNRPGEFGTVRSLADSFPRFLEQYIDPVIENSFIVEDRKIIRSSKKLNDFMHFNRLLL